MTFSVFVLLWGPHQSRILRHFKPHIKHTLASNPHTFYLPQTSARTGLSLKWARLHVVFWPAFHSVRGFQSSFVLWHICYIPFPDWITVRFMALPHLVWPLVRWWVHGLFALYRHERHSVVKPDLFQFPQMYTCRSNCWVSWQLHALIFG